MCFMLFSSCQSNIKNNGKQEENNKTVEEPIKKPAVPKYKLTAIWVNFVKANKNVFNNEITREKAANTFQKAVFDSIKNDLGILTSIPLKYETALKKGSKYIIKFSLTDYNKLNVTHIDKNGNKECSYKVAFDLFTIGDDKIIERLKDGEFYYIKSCKFIGSVNNRITLPSGNTFCQNPYFTKENSEFFPKFNLNLGGLYVTDIVLK